VKARPQDSGPQKLFWGPSGGHPYTKAPYNIFLRGGQSDCPWIYELKIKGHSYYSFETIKYES
jgi:hypothetical protein